MALHLQIRRSKSQRGKAACGEDGWVMLSLLLAMALLVIFAAAIVPSITFNIKRDREEEMIHRGVQYSRAIRAYYKKFGRYPSKIEDLESSSNQRFLRKRYKDPLNCKNSKCADFKLLHFGDVQMTLSGISGGSIPGASPIGTNGGLNGGPTAGTNSSGGFAQSSAFGGNSGFGANSNSSFGQNQQAAGNVSTGSDTSQPGSQATSVGTSGGTSGGTPGGTPDGTSAPLSGTNNPSGPGNGTSGSNQLGSGQIIGGSIVGVASISKDKTIREFNHKNKYKDWAFVYDPAQDQGRLISTPYQPQLQGFGQQGIQNVNGQSGTTGTGFGTGPGTGSGTFGSPSGTQNAPTTGGYGTPNPPSNPPPQQQ
jgi:type II secretory pathway pseudopilin PulG